MTRPFRGGHWVAAGYEWRRSSRATPVQIAYALLILFGGAFVAIVQFYVARELSVKVVRATLGRVAPRVAERATSLLVRFSDGLDFFRHQRLALQFLFETAV